MCRFSVCEKKNSDFYLVIEISHPIDSGYIELSHNWIDNIMEGDEERDRLVSEFDIPVASWQAPSTFLSILCYQAVLSCSAVFNTESKVRTVGLWL